jgi:hypothetical protein
MVLGTSFGERDESGDAVVRDSFKPNDFPLRKESKFPTRTAHLTINLCCQSLINFPKNCKNTENFLDSTYFLCKAFNKKMIYIQIKTGLSCKNEPINLRNGIRMKYGKRNIIFLLFL